MSIPFSVSAKPSTNCWKGDALDVSVITNNMVESVDDQQAKQNHSLATEQSS